MIMEIYPVHFSSLKGASKMLQNGADDDNGDDVDDDSDDDGADNGDEWC